eukprot:CAMPEP_0195542648 /NCGR_PEP_ID=MMETSP0794_2-20130614/51712_1 /TAXON_ID=515487 /ORGANISM="Stephanopyxis turris, Strain CCMP 815" /LENGTH=151 /DNA_ID=CAMNT_0040676783 /DNA_START=147 /DNA_END=602 /DNA_ORIENTATION=+
MIVQVASLVLPHCDNPLRSTRTPAVVCTARAGHAHAAAERVADAGHVARAERVVVHAAAVHDAARAAAEYAAGQLVVELAAAAHTGPEPVPERIAGADAADALAAAPAAASDMPQFLEQNESCPVGRDLGKVAFAREQVHASVRQVRVPCL